MQTFDNKERRRKALKRKKEDKKRNPMAKDPASRKYRQRVREVVQQEFNIKDITDFEGD